MKVPHLVQYQGSKRNLAPTILQYLPKKFNRLIEPFAGTAAITLACAAEDRATEYVINDLNAPLVELFKLVVEDPDYVASTYSSIWHDQLEDSISHFYTVREQFNQTHDPVKLLYLIARCVKGAVRYNDKGEMNQSPDKRRKGTQPGTMKNNIKAISSILKGKATFFSEDYKKILESAKAGDIVYMDPPYQGVCSGRDSRYFATISHNEFVEELKKLQAKGVSYILSYDGKCGDKQYGEAMPEDLNLEHIHLDAGRSTQATLLGKDDVTIESLYVTKDLLCNKKDYNIEQMELLIV